MKQIITKLKNVISKIKEKKNESIRNKSIKNDTDIIGKLPKTKNKFKIEEFLTFWALFRIWLAILFIVYLWYIAASTLDIIYLVVTAFIISIAVERLIIFFSKFLKRWLAIIISYIVLFLFLILGFLVLIPFLISNFSQIAEVLLQKILYWQNLIQNQWLQVFIQNLWLPKYFEDKLLLLISDPNIANQIWDYLTTNISNILQTMTQYMKEVSSFAFNVITSFFSAITQILIIFTLAIFFSFEKGKVVYTIATLSDNPQKTAIKLKKLYYQLWEWLKWQLMLSFFIWLAVYLWLWTLALFWINLENKFTLALIAWLMEFLPYLWPILWALPALLVASMAYWFSGFLAVWVLFIVIQQIEWWIVPIIMNKALWVSSLLILISMLFWLKILWIVGVILAIPLAVIVTLLFEDKLKEK